MSLFANFGNNNAANNNNSGTTGSLFGGQNTNQGTAGPSLFGATNTTQNTNPLQAQPTQPSIFGSSNTNATPGGGLFGATNANTNQNATGTGSGLFGSNTNQPAANGGGLFGGQAAPAAGGGLFGMTNNASGAGNSNAGATGGLFGNTAANTNTAGTGGGLFGNAAQATQQQGLNNPLFGGPGNASATAGATGTGGLFGGGNANTQQPGQTAGGGLFGGNTNAAAGQTTGGSLFGGNTVAGQTTGGGLFGGNNNAQQPAGGSLFGGNNNVQQPAGGGLFGANTNAQQPGQANGGLFGGGQAAGSSLFAAKPGGIFGSATLTNPQQQQQQQPQPQQQSTLFGSTSGNVFGGNTTTLGTSMLGAPAQANGGFGSSTLATPNSLLASRSMAGTQQNSADPHAQYIYMTSKIQDICNSWDPSSKDCRFQYNFYNLVDPKQVNLYGRPPNATNDALWEKAVRENPNPSCLVPVIGIGFDDLRLRIDAQTAQSASHIQKLNDLQQRLGALRTQHSVNNASRLLRAASTQTQLTQRIMRFVQHLHLLIPSIRSSALRPEEEALRGKLEELEEEMRRGRVKGRLNELWALIGAVSSSMDRTGGQGAQGDWAVVDEDGLAQITQILAEQQAGLQLLTKLAQKAQKDLNVIMGKSSANEGGDDGGYPEGGEALWSSTNTMRESSLR